MVTYCTRCGERISMSRKEMEARGRGRSFLCPACRDQGLRDLQRDRELLIEGNSPYPEVTEKP